MAFPSHLSLYSIVIKDLYRQFSTLREHKYEPLETVLIHYTNERLLNIIFDPKHYMTRRAASFVESKTDFEGKLNRAIDRAKSVMDDILLIIFVKSFPETYFHPDIAKALVANNKLTNSAEVPGRIAETADIVLNTMDRLSGMRYAFAMGYMHSERREKYKIQGLYNAETVEFTLLTFSYFGAKVSKIENDQDWFFFWKVVGSLMGLPQENLHNTYEKAEERMKSIHKKCALGDDGKKLLDAFRKAKFGKPLNATGEEVLEIYSKPELAEMFLSKRMREYLKEYPSSTRV
jgi:hypothetical protein